MESAGQFWMVFALLMAPAAGFFYHFRLQKKLRVLEDELEYSKAAFFASEAALKSALLRPEQNGRGPAEEVQVMPLRFLQEAPLIFLHTAANGKILQLNSFARQSLGLSIAEEQSMQIADLMRGRQFSRILAMKRRLDNGLPLQSELLSFRNRFDEDLLVDGMLLPGPVDEVLFLGFLRQTAPGFGPGRQAASIESLLFPGRWPALLLQKTGRPGEIRKLSIRWMSAAAGRLFETDPSRCQGQLLESLSHSLASLLMKRKTLGDGPMVWQGGGDARTSYELYEFSDADLIFVQLFGIRETVFEGPPAQADNQPASAERPGLNVTRLMEITEGEPGFLKELLPTYLNALEECRSGFRRSLQDSSPERLRFLHHKIKATIRTFSLSVLDDLFVEAIAWVQQGPDADPEKKVRLMAELNSLCTDTCEAIRDFAGKNGIPLERD